MQQITSSPPGAGLEGESLSRDPPPSPTGRVVLAPISEAEAAAVARWRYPPPDDLYDGSDTGREAMLDPANGYQSVHVGAEFVGFVCAGPDARVAGQTETAGVQDTRPLSGGERSHVERRT